MVLSDKAGREVVFAPAGRGAANSDLAANSDPAVALLARGVLPESPGEWKVRIGFLTGSRANFLQGKVRLWPEDGGDPRPVLLEKIGSKRVLTLMVGLHGRFGVEVARLVERNDTLSGGIPVAETERTRAAMHRLAMATGDADRVQFPEFMATAVAPIGAAQGDEGGNAGLRCTSRVVFRVAEPLPAGAELWGCLFTPHRFRAVRLNGKALQGPERPDSDDQRVNEFRATRGLAAGENTVEVDVDDMTLAAARVAGPPRFLLALGVFWVASVSAEPAPKASGPADAAGGVSPVGAGQRGKDGRQTRA